LHGNVKASRGRYGGAGKPRLRVPFFPAKIRRMTAFIQQTRILTVETRGAGFTDITAALDGWLGEAGARDGLLTLLIMHTSASLTIQENADPAVLHDLAAALDRFAPRNAHYAHDDEGPDDAPSHIKAMLTGVNLSIPVIAGKMALGTWQGIYVAEHRDRPHRRRIAAHFFGGGTP
jgi:secondary thiamine-phosphate synthase enzyme